jgi:outer membrane protein
MTRPLPTLLALALFAALPARAQSLQELYEAARTYDATYLAVRAQADAAQFTVEQRRGALRPSLALDGRAGRSEVNPPSSTQNPTGETLGSNSASLTLNGKQPLFNRTSSVAVDQASKRLEQAQVLLQAAEQQLIVRLSQAYFDVLTSQDALTAAQANKKAIGEQLASAKRNFEVGTSTITDTREAQARFDLATAQEIAADNDLRTKRIALDQLVGRSNVNPKPLAMPVVLPPVAPANVEEWVTPSQSAPAVRKSELDLDIARLDTETARAGHLPTVDAVASLGPSRFSGRGQGIPGTTTSASVGVQLAMPLYAGGAVQNAVKATLSLEEKARNDLEDARRTTAQNTRVAFFNLQSGQAQAKALEAAESSSKLALEATQLGYRVGVRVNLDVLNAQTQLFTTQRDLSKARYDVLLAGLRLRQAAGTLQPTDVSAVNALLAK